MYAGNFILQYGVVLTAAAAGAIAIAHTDRRAVCAFVVVGTSLAYVVTTRGDILLNFRFLAYVTPLVFVFAVAGVVSLGRGRHGAAVVAAVFLLVGVPPARPLSSGRASAFGPEHALCPGGFPPVQPGAGRELRAQPTGPRAGFVRAVDEDVDIDPERLLWCVGGAAERPRPVGLVHDHHHVRVAACRPVPSRQRADQHRLTHLGTGRQLLRGVPPQTLHHSGMVKAVEADSAHGRAPW